MPTFYIRAQRSARVNGYAEIEAETFDNAYTLAKGLETNDFDWSYGDCDPDNYHDIIDIETDADEESLVWNLEDPAPAIP